MYILTDFDKYLKNRGGVLNYLFYEFTNFLTIEHSWYRRNTIFRLNPIICFSDPLSSFLHA